MKVGELFEVKVDEKIEPVIKVAERSDEDKLAGEISGYVVTPLIERVLDEFLEHYTDSFRRDTTEVGVWISGYFGSGKSHLAKIMALLAENRKILGVSAAERFESRVPAHSDRHGSIIRSLRQMDQCQTDVLAFNLNTIQDAKQHDLPYLLLSQFYKARGYCANLTYARVIETAIDREGRLNELHKEIEVLSGRSWADVQSNPTFYLKFFFEAAHRVAPNHFTSADEVKEALKRAEKGELINVAFLVRECLGYLDRQQALDPTRPHRLLWILDETGQWIEADRGRLSAVQAFIEDLAVTGKGRVMAIVTTHGDMSAIYSKARALETEMKKIAGRFWLAPALTTENIEIVLEERLLKKNNAGELALRDLFKLRGGTLCDLGELADTNQKLPECSEKAFIRYYPFFPYQIHLIPEIIKSLRSKGGHGEQMSGSTRTLLGIVQDVLRDGRRQYLKEEPGALVSFDEFYFNLERSEIKPDVRTDISHIVERTGGNELTRRVAEVLYLIRELPYIPRTVDNLARFLVGDAGQDLAIVRSEVQADLERLMKAQMVARSGSEYEYLTGERRSFEEEVTTIEQDLHNEDLTQRLLERFVRTDRRNYFEEWLGPAELSYLGTRFPITLIVDGRPVVGTSGEVTLDLTTPYGRLRRDEKDLIEESLLNQRTFYVLSGRVPDFPGLLARYLAINEVATSWKGSPHRSEEARALARERETTDLVKVQKQVIQELIEGVRGSVLLFRGAQTPVPQRNGTTPKDALRALLGDKLGTIYTRLNQVQHRVVDDQKAISDVLSGKGARNSDVKSLALYHPGSGTLNEHAALIDGVLTYLRGEHQKGGRVAGRALLAHFRAPEFGWDPNAVRVAVGALVHEGRIEVSVNRRPIRSPDDPDLLETLRIRSKFENAEVAPAGEVDTADVAEARRFLIQLTRHTKIDETAPAVSQAFVALASEVKQKAEPVRLWASGAGLQLPKSFTEGLAAFDDVKGYPLPGLQVAAIVQQEGLLSAGRDVIDLYATFHATQGQAFVVLKDFVGTLQGLGAFTTERPEIVECISRFRTARSEATVAEPGVWAGLQEARGKASLALKELVAGWREQGKVALDETERRIRERGAMLEIENAYLGEVLGRLNPLRKLLEGDVSPSDLAGLPSRVAVQERALQALLETEYRRLYPEPPPAKVRTVRLAETAGCRRIRTEAEWAVARAALDDRITAYLHDGVEIELE